LIAERNLIMNTDHLPETTFRGVEIVIPAANPPEAYDRLCAALALVGEYETSTYTGEGSTTSSATSELFPYEGEDRESAPLPTIATAIVTVSEGVARLAEAPAGIAVCIVDLDNLKDNLDHAMAAHADKGVISRDIILSPVERDYLSRTLPGFLARLAPYLAAESESEAGNR
jgi:hypothetical protein